MVAVATRKTLYVAQRKRRRGKRLLARMWFLGQVVLSIALCGVLVWSVKTVYPLMLDADYFRVRTVEITGLTMLTRNDVLYLLGITDDTTLWQLDLPRLGARLERHPYIKSVILRRGIPTTRRLPLHRTPPAFAPSAG